MEAFEIEKKPEKELKVLNNKLRAIILKIDYIENLGYDVKSLKEKAEDIKHNIDRYQDINYDQSVSQEDTVISTIQMAFRVLEKYVDQLYAKFKIYEDVSLIEKELTNDMSIKKLDEIANVITNDLIIYKPILDECNDTSQEKELFASIYRIIKAEFRNRGYSILLNRIINTKIGLEFIKELIKEDTLAHISDKDIVKRVNEVLTVNDIDKTLVYLLAFNEDDYKNELISKLESEKRKVQAAKSKYDSYLKLKDMDSPDSREAKSNRRNARIQLMKKIMSRVLSLTILISANTVTANYRKNHAKYKTKMECFSTATSSVDYKNEYTSLKMDDVRITIYSPTGEGVGKGFENNSRWATTYIVKNDGSNIEDYANLNLSKADQVESSIITLSSELPDEEFTVVTIPQERDYNNKHDYVWIHYLVSIAWFIFDLLKWAINYDISGRTSGIGSLIFAYQKVVEEIEDELEELKEATELLNTKEDGEVFDKNKLKKYKKEYLKLSNEYNELIKSYESIKPLLEYNGYQVLKMKGSSNHGRK